MQRVRRNECSEEAVEKATTLAVVLYTLSESLEQVTYGSKSQMQFSCRLVEFFVYEETASVQRCDEYSFAREHERLDVKEVSILSLEWQLSGESL